MHSENLSHSIIKDSEVKKKKGRICGSVISLSRCYTPRFDCSHPSCFVVVVVVAVTVVVGGGGISHNY